ncbi:hypothetical protein Q4S45_22070 [Massilia sp. R2A-15]|uniref:hypothetical protein n=1 Tax=Massilia sp. R2A-15 TaxID=3064278 RepID=UPI002737368D|nr:hypothetical protein [Massilia sp. R2A-15]WLI89346.1 hypothetical protein Q4S45_22070 [Massilia sp. R2A-15]
MRWIGALVLAASIASAAHAANAAKVDGFRFQIVTGDDSAQTRRIADDLYKRLAPLVAQFRTELAQRRRLVYVAIGPVALRDVARRADDCVVISAFTSSQVWRAVAASAKPARAAAMTAVFAEPAPADQLQLVSLLYKRPVRVAAIIGAETGHLKPVLRGAALIEEMTPDDDINRVLNRIAPNEVLLAMPDSGIYNADNIRNILLSTYRHKQGVIGFSADMVKAGALASTYSDIEDINAQVAEMTTAFVASGELPAPQFPRYFSTLVNEGVARSLDLDVDDAARKFARHPSGKAR